MPTKSKKAVAIESKYISIAEAALILGVTPQTVYEAIRKSKIIRYREKEGSSIIKVSRVEIEAWKKHRERKPWRAQQ